MFDKHLDEMTAALVLCKGKRADANRLLQCARDNGGYTSGAVGIAQTSLQRRGMSKSDICHSMPSAPGVIVFFAKRSFKEISPFHLHVPPEMVLWVTSDGSETGDVLADNSDKQGMTMEGWWQVQKIAEGETPEDYAKRRMRIVQKGVAKRSYKEELPARLRKPWAGCVQTYFDSSEGIDAMDLLSPKFARRWYCCAYEAAIKASAAALRIFDALASLMRQGYNVLLKGPDGFPLDASGLIDAYESREVSFGHERVAVTLLNAEAGHVGWSRVWLDYPQKWPTCKESEDSESTSRKRQKCA